MISKKVRLVNIEVEVEKINQFRNQMDGKLNELYTVINKMLAESMEQLKFQIGCLDQIAIEEVSILKKTLNTHIILNNLKEELENGGKVERVIVQEKKYKSELNKGGGVFSFYEKGETEGKSVGNLTKEIQLAKHEKEVLDTKLSNEVIAHYSRRLTKAEMFYLSFLVAADRPVPFPLIRTNLDKLPYKRRATDDALLGLETLDFIDKVRDNGYVNKYCINPNGVRAFNYILNSKQAHVIKELEISVGKAIEILKGTENEKMMEEEMEKDSIDIFASVSIAPKRKSAVQVDDLDIDALFDEVAGTNRKDEPKTDEVDVDAFLRENGFDI